LFAQAALAQCEQAPGEHLNDCITKEHIEDKKFAEKLKSRLKAYFTDDLRQSDPVTFLYRDQYYREHCASLDLRDLTVTEQHLIDTPEVFKRIDPRYLKLSSLRTLVKDIIQTEKAYGTNNYTFVHGQRFEYLLAEQLFTDLHAFHQGKVVRDFLFAHVRQRD